MPEKTLGMANAVHDRPKTGRFGGMELLPACERNRVGRTTGYIIDRLSWDTLFVWLFGYGRPQRFLCQWQVRVFRGGPI